MKCQDLFSRTISSAAVVIGAFMVNLQNNSLVQLTTCIPQKNTRSLLFNGKPRFITIKTLRNAVIYIHLSGD